MTLAGIRDFSAQVVASWSVGAYCILQPGTVTCLGCGQSVPAVLLFYPDDGDPVCPFLCAPLPGLPRRYHLLCLLLPLLLYGMSGYAGTAGCPFCRVQIFQS